eukprot:scaffold437_cov111-Cylindrotheca_fusiformis.AAC.7
MRDHEQIPVVNSKSGTSHQLEFSQIDQSSKSSTSAELASRPNSSHQQGGNSMDVATKEEKHVFRVKILVTLILLLAVGVVATITYLLVDSQERSNFESQFVGYASEVVTVSREKTSQLFNALDAFSVSVSSQAAGELELQNSSWPFYRIADWSVRTQRLAELTGSDNPLLFFAPIVQQDEREEWEDFANDAYPILYQDGIEREGDKGGITKKEFLDKTCPFINEIDRESFAFVPASTTGQLLPVFQLYPLQFFPLLPIMPMSFNLLAYKETAELFRIAEAVNEPVFASFSIFVDLDNKAAGTQIMQPIYDRADTADEDRKMVGVLMIQLNWLDYFQNLFLEEDSDDGIIVVLKTACQKDRDPDVDGSEQTKASFDRVITYQIDGSKAIALGEEDLHDTRFDSLEVTETFIDLGIDHSKVPDGFCVPTLTLHVYPSETLEKKFETHNRVIYTSVVVIIFIFTVLVFLLYDFVVGRLQRKVMDRINKQDMIVANVFPSAIRDRLYQAHGNALQGQMVGESTNSLGFENGTDKMGSAPLADLFPNTSIVFADIAGFTAWSSAREPQQVFILLENIYGALDRIANRFAIFKVETVGDCYVAAAGLPEPMDDHAVVACKFAREALKKMKEITHEMEVSLGPDTAALDLRVGIHSPTDIVFPHHRSGQVTAGVLRGERSRFQLFGDTMNTASRMESSGERDRIQVTQETADLLNAAGFGAKWLIPRNSRIYVKGKGEMQTYWVRKAKSPVAKGSDTKSVDETIGTDGNESSGGSSVEQGLDPDGIHALTKTERLVEWDVSLLTSLLQQIIASRGGVVKDIKPLSSEERTIGTNGTVLEEFTPIIPLKRFEVEDLQQRQSPSSIEIGDKVKCQLRGYLSNVASMYNDNPFHNFEHANHVTASVKKLLTRIVNTDESNGLAKGNKTNAKNSNGVDLVDLAGHSYGITSDPLTQFSVVFAAIIHDLDHPGVPNSQLVKENTRSAQIHKNKSVAEQNSVELAWDMLMQDEYEDFRACIYQTREDLHRFRQLVVNTVMATDIVDKELQALRKDRWETAFSENTLIDLSGKSEESETDRENRKATIVIEHLIQASDVAHTMQHWHIYKAWNEKFFLECYGAYQQGRASSDPSKDWYKGEIGFFDFYVIPLAKKLQSCGVFGVSSDEYLNYAVANRDEWVREGEALVKEYQAKYHRKQQQCKDPERRFSIQDSGP